MKSFLDTEGSQFLFKAGLSATQHNNLSSLVNSHTDLDDKLTILTAAVYYDYCLALPGNELNSLYKVAPEFGRALKNVKINVALNKLNLMNSGSKLIELPPNLIKANNKFIDALFLFTHAELSGSIMVFMNNGGEDQFSIILPKFSGETVEDFIKTIPEDMAEGARFAFNCLLYLESGDPDLRVQKFKSMLESSNGSRAERRFGSRKISYAGVLIGFDYKKLKMYNVDTTEVQGHFRWQPYGEGRNKLKLIWIEPHTREYKNVYNGVVH